MVQLLTDFLKTITPVQSAAVNTLIQVLLFEVIMALLIPVIGILVNGIIVNGIRKIIAGLLTPKGEFFFSNYFLFAGTVIHELSHALFAFITGAKVTEIALFSPDGNSLGHVCYHTRGNPFFAALQNCFSSCAPVVTGVILSSLITGRLFPVLSKTWQWILAVYLLVSIVFHMNMSGADLKNYFRGIPVLMLFALPICFVWILFS